MTFLIELINFKPSTMKWDHTTSVMGYNPTESEKMLSRMGLNGWELVGVAAYMEKGTTTNFIYFFKRPIPE